MAKRRAEINPDLFAPTGEPEAEAQDQEQAQGENLALDEATVSELIPAEGLSQSISVGMRVSEVGILDEIANKEGIARNSIMRWALRQFMARYLRGEVQLPITETKTRRLDLP